MRTESIRKNQYIALLIAAFGIMLTMYGYWMFEKSENTVGWTATDAVITKSSRLVTSVNGKNKSHADIRFEYKISGLTYTSNQLWYGDFLSVYFVPIDAIHNYSVGDKVNAYYNPLNPHYAILEKGENETLLFYCIAGVILVMTSLSFGLYTLSIKDH